MCKTGACRLRLEFLVGNVVMEWVWDSDLFIVEIEALCFMLLC